MKPRLLSRMYDKPKCRCGRRKSPHARSCRKCFEAGKGVYHGKGRSLAQVLKIVGLELRGKPVGTAVTVDGLTFTKTDRRR